MGGKATMKRNLQGWGGAVGVRVRCASMGLGLLLCSENSSFNFPFVLLHFISLFFFTY